MYSLRGVLKGAAVLLLPVAMLFSSVVLVVSAAGIFAVDGQLVATSTGDNHRLINTNAAATSGFDGANVLSLECSGPTCSAAARFKDIDGRERGATGFQNGDSVNSTFFLSGYVYLSAGCYEKSPAFPNGGPCPAGTANGIILSQEGYLNNTFYYAPRVMCHKTTWVCTINKPDGTPLIEIPPDASLSNPIKFYAPVQLPGGSILQ